MKIALQDGVLKIIETDNVQYAILKSWGKLKWDKRSKMLVGPADIELLDNLAGIVRLPPAIDAYRRKLYRVRDAVNKERSDPDPTPLVTPPIKLPMYKHQTRAYNMALLTFGLVSPEQMKEDAKT